MKTLLEFMYLGQTQFDEQRMNEFLAVANDLQIKEIINDGYQSTTRETIEFEQALGSDISEV